MISEVVMPQMGADMTEGTIVRWLKHEGDAVERGEIIAEIETDKANVEIEAFEGGVFRKAIAGEGDVVPVGEIIAIVAAPEDDIAQYLNGARQQPAPKPPELTAAPAPPTAEAPQTTATEHAATVASEAAATPPATAAASTQRLRVSPVARRIADEHGIDLHTVHGTGPDGRIVKHDVEALTTETRTAAATTSILPVTPAAPAAMSKMRQAIARRMSQSKREAPHYYLLIDVDMTDALTFRVQANAALPEDARISVNDLIVRACALALQRYPVFNITLDGETRRQNTAANICIAIALDDGLIAPALLDAANKPLSQLAREARDLAARARGGALRPDEITAGTFTVTNLGAYGVETLIGIIQPPQTAILGVGTATPQPAVREGNIVAREMMKMALSADHRVTDGAQGAQFIADIKRLLEQPLLLVL